MFMDRAKYNSIGNVLATLSLNYSIAILIFEFRQRIPSNAMAGILMLEVVFS